MTDRDPKTPTNGAEPEESSPSIGGEALKSAPKVKIKVIDRRFWAQRHASPDAIPAEEVTLDESRFRPAYVQELEQRLQETLQQLQTISEAYRRLRSEQEGWRLRMEKQRDQAVFEFKKRILSKLLELMDNFRLALQSTAGASANPAAEPILAGLRMIYDQMERFLASEGIEKIEPVGEAFDPSYSEVVEVVEVDRDELDHRVLEVVQPGYRLGDQLLRPARVRVGQKSGGVG
jgi:molecular chaperone GrpE